MSSNRFRLNLVGVVLAALAWWPSTASAEISFGLQGSVFAGPSPSAAEVGDFDGTGRPDIAVLSGDYVWVLLGRSRGSFRTAAAARVGRNSPSSFAVGEFNADGDPDLIVLGYGEVIVLLGAEGGAFRAPISSSIPVGGASVATGDFDRDGRGDAVVVYFSSDTASVLVGRGDGTFDAPREVSVGSTSPLGSSPSVGVEDLNADGDPDLIVVTAGPDEAEVALGAAGATFEGGDATSFGDAAYAMPPAMELGDADGDAYTDLVVASDDVAVLRGQRDGSFRRPRIMPFAANAASSVELGDFDRDGLPDLAVGNFNSKDVFVFAGRGRGRFRNVSELRTSGQTHGLGVADFSGDGELDLAVADGRGISMFVNSLRTCGGRPATLLAGRSGRVTGTPRTDVIVGTAGPDVLIGRGARDVICGRGGDDELRGGPGNDRLAGEAGDDEIIGGPGRDRVGGGLGADRIVTGAEDDLVRSRGTRRDEVNCGPGRDEVIADRRDRLRGCERRVGPPVGFEKPIYLRLGRESAGALIVEDFNRDRDPDLAVANGRNLGVRSGTAGLRFGPSRSFPVGEMYASSAVAEDFNGDGDPDLAISDGGGSLSVLMGTAGAGFAPPEILERRGLAGGLPDRDRIATADFNRDGVPDLAVAGSSSNDVRLFHGEPDGGFGAPRSIPTGERPVSIQAGDFDGDSSVDLAVGHGFSGDISILRGPAFDLANGLIAGYQPHVIATEDFDQDGDSDLAIATGWVSVFAGRSGHGFAGPVTYPPPAETLASGDFNGDGDVDLAAAREDGVSILVGGRGGTFRRVGRVRVNSTPQSMAVADFDRDGHFDLALLTGDIYERGNVAILINAAAGEPR
jgi:hypothetical protein